MKCLSREIADAWCTARGAQIYVRSLDDANAQPLPGAEGRAWLDDIAAARFVLETPVPQREKSGYSGSDPHCLHNVYIPDGSAGVMISVMYARMFRKANQTRRFTITAAGNAGWEVRDEQDNRIVRTVRYTDWHRVERARMTFALKAHDLRDSGWDEA
jgi:hypothetical protein